MRKINVLILMVIMLALSLPVSAAMIVYWDMADAGAVNQGFMPGNASRADLDGDGAMDIDDFRISSTDLTGNGNHLSAWTSAWMKWTNTSFEGDFAMEATNGYADSRTDSHWSLPHWTDVELIEPLQWTVECVFQATAGTNRTLVGRIGQTIRTSDARTAAFYLAERSSARINCEFVDVTGAYFNATSANNALVAGTWYHAAAVSNGTMLKLYLKNLTDNGSYEVVATANLSSSTNPALVADDYDPAKWSSNGGSWTVACGTYNGGTSDRFPSPGKIDMVAISDEALAPGFFAYETGPISAFAACDPDPQPLNTDGTVGALNGSNQAELKLNFKAGKDPNTVTDYPVNPAILKHYVWLGMAPDSLTLISTLDQVHNLDPNLTDPANALPLTLDNNTTYYWQIEEGLEKPGGGVYAAGDPNNILGGVWSFKTVAAIPTISAHPRPAVADASGNASFSVTASATATSFQWFKVGTPDIQLVDAGIYSRTQTSTLTVAGAALADEGQFYCIAYNGTTPSTPSNSAQLWIQRLIGYWKLDGNMNDSVQDEVPGAPVHDGSMNTGDPNYLDELNSIAGTAMSFHNDGQFMTIPDSDFFNFFRDGLTVSCWYRDTGADGWRVPFSKLDPGTAGWLFGKNDTTAEVRFIVDVPLLSMGSGSAVNVSDGQWHLLTGTYDAAGDSMRLFVDGDQLAAGTVDLSNAPLPAQLVSIGGLGTDAIRGAIDEVRIYNYPRTPTQIAEMYTGFRPDEYVCVEVENGIAAYDLNDDCRVNLADFALLATEWLKCQRIPSDACAW